MLSTVYTVHEVAKIVYYNYIIIIGVLQYKQYTVWVSVDFSGGVWFVTSFENLNLI